MHVCAVNSWGVLGRCRFAKYDGGADHRHAHLRADAHGNHVPRYLLAEADAGVIAFGDDVGQPIVDDDLDLDVGIVRQQLGQRGPENRLSRVLAGRDADRAGGLRAQFAESGQFGVDLLEPWAHGAQKTFASFRRRDAACRAREQTDSEALFQPSDGVAEGRLRHAELRRGFREAALLCDGDESEKIVGVVPEH